MGQKPPLIFQVCDSAESFSGAVPASVLVQVLDHGQQVFELIGMWVEGKEIRERARIPQATSQKFQLICHPAKPGSFAQPVSVGGGPRQLPLFDITDTDKAIDLFKKMTGAVAGKLSYDELLKLIPDRNFLRRILDKIKAMSPSYGSNWKLNLLDGNEHCFAGFDKETPDYIKNISIPKEKIERSRTVTGELKEIDFLNRKIVIIYPETNKELNCSYDDSIENLLYENRRDYIKVTGQVIEDDNGFPKEIVKVIDINDLDLSPIIIDDFQFASLKIKAKVPIFFDVEPDDSKQLLCIMKSDLGIDVFSETRSSLYSELIEQISMLWDEYAKADDDKLDVMARNLKYQLIDKFEEV